MIEERLIERIKSLTTEFAYDKPFSRYLKEYFRKNPNAGSRDRRLAREWSYYFFRLGKNNLNSFETKLSVACFLCADNVNPFLEYLIKKYSSLVTDDVKLQLDEKIKMVKKHYPSFEQENIFPMHDHLSFEIEKDKWYRSFLIKPLVWIRMREKYIQTIRKELVDSGIVFYETGNPLILSFEPEASLENTKSYMNGYFEVQDYNSQLTADFFQPHDDELWWDACSGSGGKSLLLMEKNPSIRIFATDTRENILENYKARMRKAGHTSFQTQHFDFTLSKTPEIPGEPAKTLVDGAIADVPCSGSGTWSRSPEWNQNDLKSRLIKHFIPLQRKIVSDVVQNLKSGKPLVYITCSVFAEENEENVEHFISELPVILEKKSYLKGYTNRSDTLFIARFIRK